MKMNCGKVSSKVDDPEMFRLCISNKDGVDVMCTAILENSRNSIDFLYGGDNDTRKVTVFFHPKHIEKLPEELCRIAINSVVGRNIKHGDEIYLQEVCVPWQGELRPFSLQA